MGFVVCVFVRFLGRKMREKRRAGASEQFGARLESESGFRNRFRRLRKKLCFVFVVAKGKTANEKRMLGGLLLSVRKINVVGCNAGGGHSETYTANSWTLRGGDLARVEIATLCDIYPKYLICTVAVDGRLLLAYSGGDRREAHVRLFDLSTDRNVFEADLNYARAIAAFTDRLSGAPFLAVADVRADTKTGVIRVWSTRT
jgi:hypothetical protein